MVSIGKKGNLGYNTFMDDNQDNRTIADMSGVEQRGILSSWLGIMDPNVRAQHGPGNWKKSSGGQNPNAGPNVPGRTTGAGVDPSQELSPEDRRALVFYAMKYSFAIGMLFLTVFGLVILLMTFIWK